MNDDEELEKQDEQEQELDEKLLHTGKNMVNDATRRASKQVMNKFKDEAKKAFIEGTKKVGSVVFKNPKVLAVIAVIILVIILLIVLIAGIIYVIDNYNMNTIADKIGATIQDSIEIVGDENSGYSYQIKDGYLDTVRKELKEQKVDLNSLYLGENYKYLENYILAEMMMKYPKIGDDGTQGKIIVKRVLNGDSTEPDTETGDVGSEMTYVTPAKFEALKNQMSGDSKFTVYRTYNNFTDACKYTTDNRNSQRALDNERAIEAVLNSYQNVFTIDENKNILVLKYNKHVDVNGGTKRENDWNEYNNGANYPMDMRLDNSWSRDKDQDNDRYLERIEKPDEWVRYVTYDVEISKINFENMTSQYTTPFNFLLSLLIVSESPEWVNSVANLSLNDGKIILTVFDSESTTVKEEVMERTYYHYWESASSGGTVTDNVAASIDFNGLRDEMTYRNINAQVTRVESWLYDKKDKYTYEEKNETNTDTNQAGTDFYDNPIVEDYVTESGFQIYRRYAMTETITTGSITKGFTKQVGESSEKINTDLFLGLWKNSTGKVERRYNEDGTENENAKYNPDGRYVSYKRPGKIAYQTVGMEFKQSRLNQMQPSVITWLFKLLEGREDLQRQERLMKYILYVYNNVDYGETLDSDMLALFKPGSFSKGTSGGNISLTTPTVTKEQFKQALEDYYNKTGNSDFKTNFLDKADLIYETAGKYNVNPELLITKALGESGFRSPGGGNQNFWGLNTPNDSTSVYYIGTIEEAIRVFANTMESYMPGGSLSGTITERANQRAAAGANPNGYGEPGTLKGMLSVYSHLCGNNRIHREGDSGNGGNYYLKVIYGDQFNEKCGNIHRIGVDEYTIQEEADYTAWQYQQQINTWNDFFGAYGTIAGSGSDLVEFAKQFLGQGHSEFTSYKASDGLQFIQADWCAMFVSYCFDNCKLIPSVLPNSYMGCANQVNILKQKGMYQTKESGYIPSAGDIIFFGPAGGNHTGIVTGCDGTTVYTIEGNSGTSSASVYWQGSKVTEASYSLNNSDIDGYGTTSQLM